MCGGSPSNAADISAAKTGVRFEKNAATAGPAAATPSAQQRYAITAGPIATYSTATTSHADHCTFRCGDTAASTPAAAAAHAKPNIVCKSRNSAHVHFGHAPPTSRAGGRASIHV